MTSENDDESPWLCLECQSKLPSESTLIEGTVLQLYILQFILLTRLSITCSALLLAAQSFSKPNYSWSPENYSVKAVKHAYASDI